MPNHITNVLTIKGTEKEVQEVLDTIKGKDEHEEKMFIDFNKIIPMPESLHITSGSRTDFAIAILKFKENGDRKGLNKIMQYPWVQSEGITTPEALCGFLIENNKADLEDGAKALENERLYGSTDWYAWANKHWGTKWNAYGQSIKTIEGDEIKRPHTQITFDTAWGTPLPIFVKLSQMFPKVIFLVDYADEDTGHNCGTLSIKGGIAKSLYSGNGDMTAMLFAYKVQGRDVNNLIKDYITEDTIDEDENSAFGNSAFAKELIEHFIDSDEIMFKDLILSSNLSIKVLDFIEKVAAKNEAFEVAAVVVEKKKQLSLITK